MEENVALDSTKQKKFDKSIKGIKKLIKKKDAEKGKGDQTDKVKTGKIGKRKRPQRGLVYLSHIPHGFYENEMSQYFKQFGVVTNARVIKSKRTGRSKGFAFVEFKEPAVAQIVAETMNNYLMGKRLIKAAYIPPEKQKRKVFRRRWNTINNPGNNLRIKMKKAHNENKDEEGELQRARQLLTNLNKTKKKLRELGVNYDFFTPVDVPEALLKRVQGGQNNEDSKENIVVSDGKSKKKNIKAEQVNVKSETKKDIRIKSADGMEVKKEQSKNTKNKNEKNQKSKQIEADKSTQKQKKQNLKDKGVTLIEDFIKVEKDDESDSSLEFDSDEYEKMLDDDDDFDGLEDDSDDDDDGSDNSDEDDGESDDSEELPKQKGKNKSAAKLDTVQLKNIKKVAQKKPQTQPQPHQSKRKAPPKAPLPAVTQKPKFEKKSNQKPVNKQFKKKK